MSVVDVIDEQDEMKKHMWDRIVLWPRQWQKYQTSIVYKWQIHQLISAKRSHIPNKPGIYTILVQPKIFNHPACSYLMYVGKTTSLKRRFYQYLDEKKRENGRPKILRLLNKYPDHTWFCFTVMPEQEISIAEDTLLSAYIPPCNDKFPASISRVVDAFS